MIDINYGDCDFAFREAVRLALVSPLKMYRFDFGCSIMNHVLLPEHYITGVF